jgi:MoxR-like ATPase
VKLGLHALGRRGADGPPFPASASSTLADPSAYIPDDRLMDAVHVALVLGQPLLLTGEPGCGKTQLASYLAWHLDLNPLLKYETKSDSTAESLFYRYDSLRHFEASSRGDGGDPAQYITWNALGSAILATLPPEDRVRFVGEDADMSEPRRSVVLIDEIDKAPRDFPNDVLNELEHLYFRVPECGNAVLRANDGYRPIVVITSNSERDLPEPFLRRCVFNHIAFPEMDTVRRIVLNHLGSHVRGLEPLLDEAVSLFAELRAESAGLSRRPGLAEFLNWLMVLNEYWATEGRLTARTVRGTIGVLAKTAADVQRANAVVESWLVRRGG